MAVNDVLDVGVGQPAAITAPPLTLPPLTLLNIARFLIDEEAGVDPTDGRWHAGITFRREPTSHAGGWAPCGSADVAIIDDCAIAGAPPVYLPFYATYSSRAPLGQYQQAEYQQRAIRGLRAHEAWRVENEWWTGVLQPGNPFLSKPAAGLLGAAGWVLTDPAVGVKEALRRLDQAVADADVGIGVIHCTPFMLEAFTAVGGLSLVREGGRILTPNGNLVVPGNGYAGTGPDGTGGTDTNVQWAFVTDMVYLARGLIESAPERYPTNFAGGRVAESSDFVESLILAGTQVPMAAQWTAQRPWIVMTNAGLRAGIKIDTTQA